MKIGSLHTVRLGGVHNRLSTEGTIDGNPDPAGAYTMNPDSDICTIIARVPGTPMQTLRQPRSAGYQPPASCAVRSRASELGTPPPKPRFFPLRDAKGGRNTGTSN